MVLGSRNEVAEGLECVKMLRVLIYGGLDTPFREREVATRVGPGGPIIA